MSTRSLGGLDINSVEGCRMVVTCLDREESESIKYFSALIL